MRNRAGVISSSFIVCVVIISALAVTVLGQGRPIVANDIRFYPVNVQAGSPMIATIFARGDTRAMYFDVRFREPGSSIDLYIDGNNILDSNINSC